MRREDMTVPVLLLEAVTLVLAIGYIVLQIFYGFMYHIAAYKFIMNVLAMFLIYAALTILCIYPERVNRLPREAFTPDIRRLTLWMLRLVKLVFIAGILVPSVFDVAGFEMKEATSLIVIGLLIATVLLYEYRIFRILRNRQ